MSSKESISIDKRDEDNLSILSVPKSEDKKKKLLSDSGKEEKKEKKEKKENEKEHHHQKEKRRHRRSSPENEEKKEKFQYENLEKVDEKPVSTTQLKVNKEETTNARAQNQHSDKKIKDEAEVKPPALKFESLPNSFYRNTWGRARYARRPYVYGCLFSMLAAPFVVTYFMLTCSKYDGSLFNAFFSKNLTSEVFEVPYRTSLFYAGCYLVWIIVQIVLYNLPDFLDDFIPYYTGGIRKGALTPAGRMFRYNINGLQTFVVVVTFFLYFGAYDSYFSPTFIVENLLNFYFFINLCAYLMAAWSYYRAGKAPSPDCIFSNDDFYDLAMGRELNPREGRYFDYKLFFIGRLGMMSWILVNLSYALAQKEKYGCVSDSMVLINILQGVYILDFFWFENGYLHSIDMAHDHFGWFTIWGSMVWTPYVNTLQAHYLLYNPVHLGKVKSLIILCVGLAGYLVYRDANNQKIRFRSGKMCKVWGERPKFIDAPYMSGDGKTHKGFLLTSGWWGVARHVNYMGDLLLTFSFGLCCKFGNFIPYFIFFYKLFLFWGRAIRDEHKCKSKYGVFWNEYIEAVPYRFLPHVF